MKDAFLRVAGFEAKCGKPLSDKPPCAPNLATIKLRRRLIHEEARETLRALRVMQKAVENGEHVTEQMIVDVVDGTGDTKYVCEGTDHALGVDGPAVMAVICDSNDSKFGPGHWFDETGKLRKSPSFVPPDILGVIKNQRPLSEIYGHELNKETQG